MMITKFAGSARSLTIAVTFVVLGACTNGEAPSAGGSEHDKNTPTAGENAASGAGGRSSGGKDAIAGATGVQGGAGGTVTGGSAGASGSTTAGSVFGQLACEPGAEGNGVHETKDETPPEEWTLKQGVMRGKVTASAEYVSTTYDGYKFPYRIYTSANYEQGQPALFLVFGDGGMYLDGAYRAATVIDNLTAEGALLPTVALLVDPGPNRVNIYDPPTDKYARFLTEELIAKVILPDYTVSRDPDAWATVGYSASGEAGFAVVWHRPEQFHNFFGHSASFGASIRYDNWVWADKIQQSPKRELRVSLVVAAAGDLTDDRGSWRTINENIAKALDTKGNSYRLIIGPGDHGGLASQQDFPKALRWMWRNCEFVK